MYNHKMHGEVYNIHTYAQSMRYMYIRYVYTCCRYA